jgi:hypothetical protein
MQKHEAVLSAFQFKRVKSDLIQVFNAGSYLMAEYNERTGAVSWQRLLLTGQREIVERWLRERYPIKVAGAPSVASVATKVVAAKVVAAKVTAKVVAAPGSKPVAKRAVAARTATAKARPHRARAAR